MAKETKITLKVLVDRNTKKVLYAEAKKDFVDFLFGLLQVPIGSITKLLRESTIPTPGSFGRVLDSVLDMEPTYFHSTAQRGNILYPKLISDQTQHNPPLMLKNFASFEERDSTTSSSQYGRSHSSSSSASKQPVELGYVKDGFTYMVTDDLKVSPMSTISLITILNTFGVKDIGSLVEMTVNINFNMGLELVKASLESDSVLTDTFLGRKKDELNIGI